MKRSIILAGLAAFQLLYAQGAFAAAKVYQVSGPIVEVSDKLIVIQKGDERWELDRDADTKIVGELKVGQKVTVYYRMQATKVESKETKASSKEKSK
jgi:hypothetical protein